MTVGKKPKCLLPMYLCSWFGNVHPLPQHVPRLITRNPSCQNLINGRSAMSNETKTIDKVELQNLRDYFAAHAMSAFIDQSSNQYEIARWSYQLADAMLEERMKVE